MPKFVKKPIIVEAIQFDGTIESAAILESMYTSNVWHDSDKDGNYTGRMCVQTLEGIIYASPGDWIITGVKGERYPCKDDIFRATYDPVES